MASKEGCKEKLAVVASDKSGLASQRGERPFGLRPEPALCAAFGDCPVFPLWAEGRPPPALEALLLALKPGR